MSQPLQLALVGEPQDPPSGLTYPVVLRRPGFSGFTALFGALLAFIGFALVVPLVSALVTWVGFLVRGGGDFEAYSAAASAYELPEGPAAGHLALAALIPLCVVLVRYVHGMRPRWLASVQPGVRWRYLALSLLVAAVILNAVTWASFWFGEMPVFHGGQDGWVWFLLVVGITSPLQAAAEEVFFRGYLLQVIGSATGRAWAGVVGSALVFALLHGVQNPALFAHRLAFGLVAGALVVVTGGLEAGIAAHVVNNVAAYAYAIFTSSVAALRGVTTISWAEAAWNVGAFAAFGVAAWWVGRRLRVATLTP